jgi:HK97 family phage major capsid protein
MVLEKRAITSANYPINPIRVGSFAEPQLPLAIRDLLTVVALGATNAVEYVKETWNLLADYQVAEGDKKAESTGSGTLATAMVRTIAHFAKMSRQMVADAPAFAASLNAQLIYGVLKKEDIELLHGDNTAGHLHGIYVQAPALPAGILTDITNSADRILAAIAHLASLGYRATAIVVGPTAWAQMQILKNTQGAYILGGPPAMTAPPTLWGVPVVPTFAMTGDAFLVGEFAPNATLFDRESVTVDIAYENEDDFVKNMVTVRAEERIALAVFRPNAFVKGVLTVAGP